MNLIGYVSDEDYLALPDVQADFESANGGQIYLLRSSARGAFYGDVPDGSYRVTLSKAGYGAKWVNCELKKGSPYQFRLLSDSVYGYVWPKWIRSGEQSEIRVHSPEQYQLSLWRYGLIKEHVQTLSWFDEHGPRATVQVTPDGDYSLTGVNWNRYGYLAVHPQQVIVAPEKSGLYYLWARTVSGRMFSFPWVVAPKTPKSKIAVLASSNTWNAYNNFGGRSNYVNPAGLPPTPTVNARLDLARYTDLTGPWSPPDADYKPLAFERPEVGNHIFDNDPWSDTSIKDPIKGRVQSGQAPGEWRLLGWLEEQGFEYDYYAEAQLHDSTLDLDSYKLLIISVHPEYWTRAMYDRVERWVRAGGHLMYLGGNGLNCEITIEGDIMRCLSHDDTKSPKSNHDSRMHRTFRSEAALLGVAFTDPGAMTAAPYRVLNETHWVYSGTGLKKGDLFGEHSLHERVPGGASGHETDKITASSPQKIAHLAKGTNANEGGADMVYFELDKGAVFSVGSITWVACLFPDESVSRITRNVIERFVGSK
ncbi:MAG TPA: N,N-dimethylformamidase beta subunit family domain-containing protein [Terriglobales bacterium]|nr:N,N-dimethylformamidase beta subunit family domain-containing protein [Terriglobales bacterium]